MTSRTRYPRITLAAAAALAGGVLFLCGYWAGSAGGSTTEPGAGDSRAVPDWFLDIADYYDRNPEVTPTFDLASLYDSRPGAYVGRPRPKGASR